MADEPQVASKNPSELLASGRRHLIVRDFTNATSALAEACELLAAKFGDTADECGDAYLWYGKALLGLAREESGVLGDGIAPGGEANNEEDDEDDDDDGKEETEDGDADKENDKNEASEAEPKVDAGSSEQSKEEKSEDEPTEGISSTVDEQPGTSNGVVQGDEVADLDEDEVENLQLAWEMLDLSRGIITKRLDKHPEDQLTKQLLAEIHLALGEVALESETYDKAIIDMQKCLDIQKSLYQPDDRRIAETHYQIALSHSLSSNFEDAITHYKNAVNILETRVRILENPTSANQDPTVKKYSRLDPFYSVPGEIKELKDLLPEIQEKIQDMMEYKAEAIKQVRETLSAVNGSSSIGAGSSSNGAGSSSNGAGPSTSKPATDISHLVKRKRKPSDSEDGSSAKKPAPSSSVP